VSETELIVRLDTELVLPVEIDFEADRQTHSTVEAADLKFPFLQLLQDGSPLVKKGPRKLADSEAGMILNTLTGELFSGEIGIPVLPVTTSIRKYDEWIPQDEGGGFRGSYFPDHIRVTSAKPGERRGTLIPLDNPEGTELIETAYFFLVFPQTLTWAVCTMASKKWQSARTWNTLIDGVRFKGKNGLYPPAPYAVQYRLGTVQVDNKGKEPSYIYTVKSEGRVTDANVYTYAKEFAQKFVAKVQAGEVEVKPTSSEQADNNAGKSDADECAF
jgi:hypothetical protein